jgi:hypothetical protein
VDERGGRQTNLASGAGVKRIFFKRHLKLFEEPENIGSADLGNQNRRASPVAPQQPWKANITFSNGNAILAPESEFFPGGQKPGSREFGFQPSQKPG